MPDFVDRVVAEVSLVALVSELNVRVSDLIGLTIDASMAFRLYAARFEEIQIPALQGGETGSSLEEADKHSVIYGTGHPDDPKTVAVHVVNIGEMKRRNQIGGLHHTLISRMVLVSIFAIWDDEFRPRIAKALSVPLTDIRSDIFGDIRLLRNSVVHHGGVALPEVAKCKVFCRFNPGDEIKLDQHQIIELLFLIRKSLDDLVLDRTGLQTELARRITPNGTQAEYTLEA